MTVWIVEKQDDGYRDIVAVCLDEESASRIAQMCGGECTEHTPVRITDAQSPEPTNG